MARIICLANSYKHGGRCIAGIDPKSGNWIRPVPDTKDRAITPTMRLINGREPQILDVIEIPLEDYGPDEGCQPENRLLKPGIWKKVGRVAGPDLLKYCVDDNVILHNHRHYVLPEFFTRIRKSEWRSLQLVRNSNVSFNRAYKINQWRVSFQDGRRHILNLKLTDPDVSDRLKNDEKISHDCILAVSLATPWSPPGKPQPERCYKMVAGVIEL